MSIGYIIDNSNIGNIGPPGMARRGWHVATRHSRAVQTPLA
jgi:hypothetical protein